MADQYADSLPVTREHAIRMCGFRTRNVTDVDLYDQNARFTLGERHIRYIYISSGSRGHTEIHGISGMSRLGSGSVQILAYRFWIARNAAHFRSAHCLRFSEHDPHTS